MTGRAGSKRTDRGPWTPARQDQLWKDLGSPDAALAFRAVHELAGVPDQAARLLGRKLLPPAPLDKAARDRFRQLVRDLDARNFQKRQKASRALAAFGEPALPLFHETLAGALSPEVRRRLQRLAEDLEKPTGERLRALRGLEALECANDPETRKVLKELAGGQPAAWLTREARAALQRQARRSAAP